jgi:hypothetical protein
MDFSNSAFLPARASPGCPVCQLDHAKHTLQDTLVLQLLGIRAFSKQLVKLLPIGFIGGRQVTTSVDIRDGRDDGRQNGASLVLSLRGQSRGYGRHRADGGRGLGTKGLSTLGGGRRSLRVGGLVNEVRGGVGGLGREILGLIEESCYQLAVHVSNTCPH